MYTLPQQSTIITSTSEYYRIRFSCMTLCQDINPTETKVSHIAKRTYSQNDSVYHW